MQNETRQRHTFPKSRHLRLPSEFSAVYDARVREERHVARPDLGPRHAVRRLAKGGTILLVEPLAAERPEDNRGPLAAMNYAASTALCTPNALCHPGGIALGAQAGPEALRMALAEGGLGHFRVAATTPFHMVIEARAH